MKKKTGDIGREEKGEVNKQREEIRSQLYRKMDMDFGYALLTFDVKTDILRLTYCGIFIDTG